MIRAYCSWATALLATALVLLALPGRAAATEARHEALADNPLVACEMDVIDFPGLAGAYGNLVFLTVQPPTGGDASTMDGNLGVLLGRDLTVGLWVHRRPRWQDLDEMDVLFELNRELPPTYHLFDLVFGTASGFGLRLAFAAGLDSSESWNEDDKLVSSGGTSFGAELQLGYSFDTDAYHGDLGAGLSLSWFEIVENGHTLYEAGMTPSFMVRHRSVIGPRADVAGVVDVLLTRRAYSVVISDEDKKNQQGDMGRWVAELTAGPQLRLPGNLTVWLGLQFSLENLGGDIAKQQQPILRAIGFPGLFASAEVLLWDTLAVRAGVDYDVYWSVVEVPWIDPEEDEIEGNDDDPVAAGTQSMGQRFDWSTGLGLHLADFEIDATISHTLYFDGPSFIGGREPGFLGLVSAAYLW